MKRQSVRKFIQLVSFLLFPALFFYFSPYLSQVAAWQGIVAGSLFSFAVIFIFSLIFGRAFCGWICAAGAFQEYCFQINAKPVRRGNWLKYVIWAIWLMALIAGFINAGGIKKVDPAFYTEQGLSATSWEGYIAYLSVLALFLVLSLAVGKRSACHHLCWMAPFMVLGRKLRNLGRWPALKLKNEAGKCSKCGKCTKECPMSLDVQKMVTTNRMEESECILCGVCSDNCPKQAISLRF